MLKSELKWFFLFTITSITVFSSPIEQKNINLYSKTKSNLICSDSCKNYTPYRILREKGIEGNSVKTDDGAIWITKDEPSRSTIKSWRLNDTLVIHPCFFPYWSGASFYLFNERLQTTVVVDLDCNESYNDSSTSVTISAIYPNTNQIEVVDAYNRIFRFTVDSSDFYILSEWKSGEYILFGSNENCIAGKFSSHPYIIINMHTKNYLRASIEKQIEKF